ncbi:hypothetical protein REPUB_Repub17cG0144700 [Reevesia pubescens]
MSMEMEEEDRGKVGALIEKATNSTAAEVDLRFLKAIKLVVRFSDSELRIAANELMDLMKRDHSRVRYLTLLIIDEFFMRSKLFRTLLVENLDQLLALNVGFRRNMLIPAPPTIASTLRSKAIEFLEKWNASFGIHYRQLRLRFDYLKNTLRFQFPNLQENAARRERERRERERRTQEILQNKFETLKTNFSSVKEEIQSTVDEIRECLDIVHSKEEIVLLGLLDDEDFVEFHSSELRQIRLDSLKEGEKVHENSDNKVVFDALRVLSRDSMLKELIDIRNRLLSVKKDCEESGFAQPKTVKNKQEEEEDFWEEGNIGSTENGSSTEPEKQKEAQSSNEEEKIKSIEDSNSKKSNKRNGHFALVSASSKVKDKAKEYTPVVNCGSFLDNWGPVSNRDMLVNQRGLELESYWGRVDYGAVIPAEKIAELNLQETVYQVNRAKLAKVREHNEAVLRDAVMASTSRSAVVGEDIEETIGENQTNPGIHAVEKSYN